MTLGSSMHAMTRSLPPHLGQVSMSMEKTRFSRRIQLIGAVGWSLSTLPRGRCGTMRARCLQLGANTPWKRVRLRRGLRLVWQLPTVSFLGDVLHNPLYGGALCVRW